MLIWVPIDRVVDSPHQVRRRLSDTHLLANDIAEVGLLHPPTGRVVWLRDGPDEARQVDFAEFMLRSAPRVGFDGGSAAEASAWWDDTNPHARVELTGGHRRLAAIGALIDDGRWLAELTRRGIEGGEPDCRLVPMEVRGLPADVAARAVVTENLARVDLTPLERLRAFEALRDAGYTVKAIADIAGVSRSTMSHGLAVLELPESVLAYVDNGELSPGVARYLRQLRCRDEWAEEFMLKVIHPVQDGKLVNGTRERLAGSLNSHLRYLNELNCKLGEEYWTVITPSDAEDSSVCVHNLTMPSMAKGGELATCQGATLKRWQGDRRRARLEAEVASESDRADRKKEEYDDCEAAESAQWHKHRERIASAVSDELRWRVAALLVQEPWLERLLASLFDFDEEYEEESCVLEAVVNGVSAWWNAHEVEEWERWLEKYDVA